MYRRIAFIFALAGAVLSIHLWIQENRDFSNGCLGIGAGVVIPGLDGCRAPELERARSILGVSTALIGYLYFVLIAALGWAAAIARPSLGRHARFSCDLSIAAGMPMAMYLAIVQVFVAKALCPLCMVAEILVFAHALMWVLHRRKEDGEQINAAGEIVFAATTISGTIAVLAALLVFMDGRGGARNLPRQAPPKYPQTINVADWVDEHVPYFGHGDVQVVAFLDPNCPHCGPTYASLRSMEATYSKQARFYVIPRMLWARSMLQVEALDLAKQTDRYYDLWTLQFERRQSGGMNFEMIESVFRELHLDTSELKQRLEASKPSVLARTNRQKAAGLSATPLIYVEGKLVANTRRYEDGIAAAIGRAVVRQALADVR